MIGNWAHDVPASPFGTANSPPNSYVTELSGLQQLASSSSDVTYLSEMSLNPASSVWYQPATGDNGISNAGVKAEYFSNTSFSGDPVLTRVEPGVNLNWTTGSNVTNAGSTAVSGFSPTAAWAFGTFHHYHQAHHFGRPGVQGACGWPVQTLGQ